DGGPHWSGIRHAANGRRSPVVSIRPGRRRPSRPRAQLLREPRRKFDPERLRGFAEAETPPRFWGHSRLFGAGETRIWRVPWPKPRNVKDYSDRAGKWSSFGTAWWGARQARLAPSARAA